MNIEKIVFGIIQNNVKTRIDEFRSYSFEIERKFDKDKDAINEAYREGIKGLSADEIKEFDYYFPEDYHLIENVYLDTYRKSTLVSIYSFLENTMGSVCNFLHKMHSYPIEPADLHGEGIVRSRTYYEKIVKIDFSLLNTEWGNLKTLNKIRNCIVHAEGDLKLYKSGNALKKIMLLDSKLSLRRDREIVISREYLEFTLNEVEAFLNKLFSQINKK